MLGVSIFLMVNSLVIIKKHGSFMLGQFVPLINY